MGHASISCKFAVTALLVPASLFEPRKLQSNDVRLRSRFRLGNVCGAVEKLRPSAAFTGPFSFRISPSVPSRSKWIMTVDRAKPESLTNSARVTDPLLLFRTSSIFLSKKSRCIPRKKHRPIKIHFCLNYATSWRAGEHLQN